MNKTDKEWARAKIFAIIDTPTAQLLVDDPRDKLVKRRRMDHVSDSSAYTHGPRNTLKREKQGQQHSHENEQMQLFAKYLAEELKRRGFDQK
jgi:hypothetical protein